MTKPSISRKGVRSALGGALVLVALSLPGASRVGAVTPLQSAQLSPDVTVDLSGLVVDDEGVVADNLAGTVIPVGVGAIPSQAGLDAYHVMSNGDRLLSFDTTIVLPGGLTARPGDVVRYDGASYALAFAAAPVGVPDGANLDAVAVVGSAFLFSFDVSVELNGIRFDDEDLLAFDGALFSLFFDGSAAGISPELDLDAAHYVACNGHLLLSFDGSGTVGGLSFDDEDLLEYDRVASWGIAYDGSAEHVSWPLADLDAAFVTIDPGPGPPAVFGQTIRPGANKSEVVWTNAVPFQAVRGAFALSSAIASYAVTASWSGSGNVVSDPAIPVIGAAYWYLVKPGGCLASSWQSPLGGQPGRDAAIP